MSRIFYRNLKFLKKRLAEEIAQGYDSLHLIGGVSLDGSYAALIFMYFYDELLREKFLMVIPYKSSYFKTEVSKKSTKKETPIKTIIREVEEETGVKLSKKDVKLFHKVDVYEKGKPGIVHTKYFFRMKRYLEIKEIPNDFYEGLGEVSSPFFIKSSLIKKHLFSGHLAVLGK